MGKILLWFVIVLAVLTVWRIANARAAGRQQRAAAPGGPAPRPARDGKAEAMVRCAHCGIHLPRSEALLMQGRTWCSPEHARLGPKA